MPVTWRMTPRTDVCTRATRAGHTGGGGANGARGDAWHTDQHSLGGHNGHDDNGVLRHVGV